MDEQYQFDLEDILAEFRDPARRAPAKSRERSARTDGSNRLVLRSMDSAVDDAGMEMLLSSLLSSDATEEELDALLREDAAAPAPPPETGDDLSRLFDAEGAEEEARAELEAEPEPPRYGRRRRRSLSFEDLERRAKELEPEPETDAESEPDVRLVRDGDPADDYASSEDYELAALLAELGEDPDAEPEGAPQRPAAEKKQGKRKMNPLLALLALLTMRRERRAAGEQRSPTLEQTDDVDLPEMAPDRAARLYRSQMRGLRFRARLATVLSLVMLYVSLAWYSDGLPLTGALNGNVRVVSLLLLIFEIAVVTLGLDLFTGGLLSIPRRRMGAETLVSVSCALSLLDAVVTAITGSGQYGIPFSAVGALSMCFALWGAYWSCKGRYLSFRVLTSSKTISTLTGERDADQGDLVLLKSRRGWAGFVRRSEEADMGEYVYGALTPFLLIATLVLGLLSSLARGQAGAVVHCLSVIASVCAAFSATVCFSLPFVRAARHLQQSGAAIAGWGGLQDLGQSRRVVITDSDLFPKGTVEVSRIRVLEGYVNEKVIGCTASMMIAGGSGLAAPFAELMRRNGYALSKVENFEPHDGGGMTAMVDGESVFVGSAGFMNLMGVRLPRQEGQSPCVYTAVNGALVGIFTVDYLATGSVQDALVELLRSRLEPIFALRDFNLTPDMLQQKFRIPTDTLRFPGYIERFRLSGVQPGEGSRVAAVLAREGMAPLVEAAERGRRVHSGVRIVSWLSAVGSVFGALIMFLLCWLGAFDSASASNVILYMLLWLLPLIAILIGLERR